MVQILEEVPSFSSAIGSSFKRGISKAFENLKQKGLQEQQQKNLIAENEAAKRFGLDLSGITDPKLRQIAFQEKIQELVKSAETEKKQSFLREIMQGKRPDLPSLETIEGIKPTREPTEIGEKEYREPFSEGQILAASLQDPNLSRTMTESNKAALKEFTESKRQVSESFKENEPYINKTYDQYEDSLRREAILDRMNQLVESGQLSSPALMNTLEQLGLQSEWVLNPANEEYQKLALDLLGGGTLQADYGSRVLQSEFAVSMKRIPSLLQTDEGKREIAENMKTMMLPSRLKQERLDYYLDQNEKSGKPLPHNLRGKILKDIKPQLEAAYDKFKQRNGRYEVKKGTVPSDRDIEKYFYIANEDTVKAKKMMAEDGYDTR